MRRFAILVTSTLAVSALAVAPQAQAQNASNLLGLLTTANQAIETMDCGTVDTVLTATGLVDDTTTRGELVAELNSKLGTDPALRLLTVESVNTIADRALECGVVQPDPAVDPLTALLTSSGPGSSQYADVLPLLTVLSSAAN